MRLKEYDRILWDFNGTLLDDVGLAVSSNNTLLARRGLPLIASEDAYREVFCFPVADYYRELGLESEGEAFTRVAHEWMKEYRAGEKDAPLRAGALAALDTVRAAGVPQGILSATEETQLEEQVTALGIRDYFDHLFGREDIDATDKSGIAARYRREHPEERVLMIGDTVHDVETAKAGGFDCVLVAGGHQSLPRIAGAGVSVFPDYPALIAYLTEGAEA